MYVAFCRRSVVNSQLEVTVSSFMSSCLSFHFGNLNNFWINFCETLHWSFGLACQRNSSLAKWDTITEILYKRPTHYLPVNISPFTGEYKKYGTD